MLDKTISTLWKKLSEISSFEFTSNCRKIPPSYEPRKGRGEILVKDPNSETITFFEKGKWRGVQNLKEIGFTNVIRWCFDPKTGLLSLEHLRMGVEKPMLLFTLQQIEENLFKSLAPHQCKEDTYYGSVLFDEHYVHLNWRIIGPKKNEALSVVYS